MRLGSLPRLLTGDAVPRPRECFQPLRFNVAAAFGTLTVVSLPDPLQCPVQTMDLLLGSSSFVGECLPLVLGQGLISGVRLPCRACSRLFRGAGKKTLCFDEAGFENLLEVLGFFVGFLYR